MDAEITRVEVERVSEPAEAFRLLDEDDGRSGRVVYSALKVNGPGSSFRDRLLAEVERRKLLRGRLGDEQVPTLEGPAEDRVRAALRGRRSSPGARDGLLSLKAGCETELSARPLGARERPR